MTEGQTPVVAGKRAVLEAIRAGEASEVLIARGSRQSPGMRDVLDAARSGHVRTREVDRTALDALADDHRGVVAKIDAMPTHTTLGERDLSTFSWDDDAVAVVLDGVEDPQNLGAAARSIEAGGARMLITRTHRAAPVTPAAVRASAGALLHLPHARVANLARAIERLQDARLHRDRPRRGRPGIDRRCKRARAVASRWSLGSEGSGMSRLVREHCDLLVSLPMHGKVGSLNAAASLAAVLYAYVLPSRGGG